MTLILESTDLRRPELPDPSLDSIGSTDGSTPTGTMQVLSYTDGDTEISWDRTRPEEVRVARLAFNRLRDESKYLLYKQEGENREKITEFDPDAGRIIATPQLVGG